MYHKVNESILREQWDITNEYFKKRNYMLSLDFIREFKEDINVVGNLKKYWIEWLAGRLTEKEKREFKTMILEFYRDLTFRSEEVIPQFKQFCEKVIYYEKHHLENLI